jgi:hypothetical protein
MRKRYLTILFTMLAACLGPVLAQSSGPLTRSSFDTLIRTRGHLPNIVITIIGDKGIGFLPTQKVLGDLTAANVHPDIIRIIKQPETYTRNLMVHICHYSAPADMSEDERRFTADMHQKLSNGKDDIRLQLRERWPLLRGIPYDDDLGPKECFDQDHPKRPGISYVTVRGNMRRLGGRKLVDTVFTYLPLGGNPEPLGQSLEGIPLERDSGDRIVREALTRLENKLK